MLRSAWRQPRASPAAPQRRATKARTTDPADPALHHISQTRTVTQDRPESRPGIIGV